MEDFLVCTCERVPCFQCRFDPSSLNLRRLYNQQIKPVWSVSSFYHLFYYLLQMNCSEKKWIISSYHCQNNMQLSEISYYNLAKIMILHKLKEQAWGMQAQRQKDTMTTADGFCFENLLYSCSLCYYCRLSKHPAHQLLIQNYHSQNFHRSFLMITMNL